MEKKSEDHRTWFRSDQSSSNTSISSIVANSKTRIGSALKIISSIPASTSAKCMTHKEIPKHSSVTSISSTGVRCDSASELDIADDGLATKKHRYTEYFTMHVNHPGARQYQDNESIDLTTSLTTTCDTYSENGKLNVPNSRNAEFQYGDLNNINTHKRYVEYDSILVKAYGSNDDYGENTEQSISYRDESAEPTLYRQVSSYIMQRGGIRGCVNLGNTCYFNAALQCLCKLKPLSELFLSLKYKSEINKENVLGSGGRVADAYYETLVELWDNRDIAYSPKILRHAISAIRDDFGSYAQQDAQEFLSCLLDSLHEDLNRVKKRVYFESSISRCNNMSEKQVAALSWERHLQVNNSAIVDLFHGQYCSRIKCPVCDKLSLTYEPFMMLSLPIPKIQKRTITYEFDMFPKYNMKIVTSAVHAGDILISKIKTTGSQILCTLLFASVKLAEEYLSRNGIDRHKVQKNRKMSRFTDLSLGELIKEDFYVEETYEDEIMFVLNIGHGMDTIVRKSGMDYGKVVEFSQHVRGYLREHRKKLIFSNGLNFCLYLLRYIMVSCERDFIGMFQELNTVDFFVPVENILVLASKRLEGESFDLSGVVNCDCVLEYENKRNFYFNVFVLSKMHVNRLNDEKVTLQQTHSWKFADCTPHKESNKGECQVSWQQNVFRPLVEKFETTPNGSIYGISPSTSHLSTPSNVPSPHESSIYPIINTYIFVSYWHERYSVEDEKFHKYCIVDLDQYVTCKDIYSIVTSNFNSNKIFFTNSKDAENLITIENNNNNYSNSMQINNNNYSSSSNSMQNNSNSNSSILNNNNNNNSSILNNNNNSNSSILNNNNNNNNSNSSILNNNNNSSSSILNNNSYNNNSSSSILNNNNYNYNYNSSMQKNNNNYYNSSMQNNNNNNYNSSMQNNNNNNYNSSMQNNNNNNYNSSMQNNNNNNYNSSMNIIRIKRIDLIVSECVVVRGRIMEDEIEYKRIRLPDNDTLMSFYMQNKYEKKKVLSFYVETENMSSRRVLSMRLGLFKKCRGIDLSSCLALFSENEILDEFNKWYCSKCKDFVSAHKKLQLWKTPDVLIFHLKRFEIIHGIDKYKIETHINYPIDEGNCLNVSQYLCNDSPFANNGNENYTLVGVICHTGNLSSGHYFAYSRVGTHWYCFNDSNVRLINDESEVNSPYAYLLYYTKLSK